MQYLYCLHGVIVSCHLCPWQMSSLWQGQTSRHPRLHPLLNDCWMSAGQPWTLCSALNCPVSPKRTQKVNFHMCNFPALIDLNRYNWTTLSYNNTNNKIILYKAHQRPLVWKQKIENKFGFTNYTSKCNYISKCNTSSNTIFLFFPLTVLRIFMPEWRSFFAAL